MNIRINEAMSLYVHFINAVRKHLDEEFTVLIGFCFGHSLAVHGEDDDSVSDRSPACTVHNRTLHSSFPALSEEGEGAKRRRDE